MGDALQRSAASLYAAGNDIDQSIGLITAANSIVQDPEQIGNALKVLAMRISGTKTELEAAGEYTDGMADSSYKLREELMALTNQKVDIKLDGDTFKEPYQILSDLSIIWEDLTDAGQTSILELIAGNQNSNVIEGIIKNFEDAENASVSAANSSGSAWAEHDKHLGSIEGKLTQFGAAFQGLSIKALDSDTVKGVVDIGTTFTKLAADLADIGALLPLILSTILSIKNNVGRLKMTSLRVTLNMPTNTLVVTRNEIAA